LQNKAKNSGWWYSISNVISINLPHRVGNLQ
jgi:hypothetical protein